MGIFKMEMFIIGVGIGFSIAFLMSGMTLLYLRRKQRRLNICKRLQIIHIN